MFPCSKKETSRKVFVCLYHDFQLWMVYRPRQFLRKYRTRFLNTSFGVQFEKRWDNYHEVYGYFSVPRETPKEMSPAVTSRMKRWFIMSLSKYGLFVFAISNSRATRKKRVATFSRLPTSDTLLGTCRQHILGRMEPTQPARQHGYSGSKSFSNSLIPIPTPCTASISSCHEVLTLKRIRYAISMVLEKAPDLSGSQSAPNHRCMMPLLMLCRLIMLLGRAGG
jgi:hypothetical protein